MPEATHDIHDSQGLEARVGALLDDMQAATSHLSDQVREETAGKAAAPPMPSAADSETQLAGAVTAMAAETPAQGGSATAPPPQSVIPEPPPAPDLAKAVDDLLSQNGAPGKSAAAPTTPAGAGAKIEALDAELAGLADDLIAGEFADESAVLRERPPEPSTLNPLPPPSPEAAPPAPKPEPPPIVSLPAPPERDITPAPPPPVTTKSSKRVASAAGAAAAKTGKRAAAAARPWLLKALAAMSSPLRGKPHLRDTIGWIALVQAFLALCVWMYVLFFRPVHPLDPAPVAAVKAPEPEAAEGAHAAKKEGHQSSSKKKPAKKDKAKSETAHH